jgi:transposase
MGKKKRGRPTVEVNPQELAAIVDKTKTSLSAADFAKLQAAMSTLTFLQAELQQKGTSIDRLRRMLFGAPTEKTGRVLKEKTERAKSEQKPPAPGHGRNPAAAYTGAERKKVAHASLHGGECCAECLKGRAVPRPGARGAGAGDGDGATLRHGVGV